MRSRARKLARKDTRSTVSLGQSLSRPDLEPMLTEAFQLAAAEHLKECIPCTQLDPNAATCSEEGVLSW